MRVLKTDYLVVGAGATGLGFTDTLVAESDAEVLLVDRRPEVGGHWNEAYSFVRLHQPSINYGMPSLQLGAGRVTDGQQERATGREVLEHFRRGFLDVLLPTGQVRFTGGVEVDLDGPPVLRDLITGEMTEVVVRRKVVDARYGEGTIPATHAPSYDVADDAHWVPVGELPQVVETASSYVVVGAGKTGMDACTFLLNQGVGVEAITWVRPRDPWLLDRAGVQPLEDVSLVIEAMSLDLEAVAQCSSHADLFARLEASGRLLRLDDEVEPTVFRCASVDRSELAQLRSVHQIVRLGHVVRVEPDRLVLTGGEHALSPGTVVVDCSASGIRDRPSVSIFTADRLTIQYVRQCSPSLSAALIAWVEVHRDDLVEQNRLCPANRPPSLPSDWLRSLLVGLNAAKAWRDAPDLLTWMENCRLDISRGAINYAHELRMQEAFLRRQAHLKPALARLSELLAEATSG